MNLILQLILLVLGFTMLVKGADWFVEGASGLAEKFGIPQLVIGLTIVAMGTSMPEAAVTGLKDSIDCNLYFFGTRVEVWVMYLITIATI